MTGNGHNPARGEVSAIAASRSQSVILKRGENIKYLPYVFTEHGAIMAAKHLNSPHAVRMSVSWCALHPASSYRESQKDLMAKLKELESAVTAHDSISRRYFPRFASSWRRLSRRNGRLGFWLKKDPPATDGGSRRSF